MKRVRGLDDVRADANGRGEARTEGLPRARERPEGYLKAVDGTA